MPGHLFEGNPVREGTTRRGTANPVHHPEKPAESTHSSTRGLTLKLTSIESVMPSSHLILCRPLLLLPQSLPAVPFARRALPHPISTWPVPTPSGSSPKPLIGGHGLAPLLTCGSPSCNLTASSVWVCVSPIVQQGQVQGQTPFLLIHFHIPGIR